MRFKVNNKYIIDAKSRDDAIRVVKMLDAMETYSIRWIDTYAKSKGYGPDFWRYDTEIKANNVKEALETLAKHVALGGTGTANCLVMHVSNSHATYQFSGRLSDLLKKTKEQLGDSVKDADEYMIEGNIVDKNDPMMTYQAYQNIARKYHLTIKNYTGGMLDLYGSKENLQRYERDMHMSYSAIEKAHDSVKDAEPDSDVDLDFLIKDELEAIDGYRKMIAKTTNPQLLSVLSHILDEETEHVEELRAAQAGVYEVDVDDSIKDSVKDERTIYVDGTTRIDESWLRQQMQRLFNVQSFTTGKATSKYIDGPRPWYVAYLDVKYDGRKDRLAISVDSSDFKSKNEFSQYGNAMVDKVYGLTRKSF